MWLKSRHHPRAVPLTIISKDLILQHWSEWALVVRRQGGHCWRQTYISLSLGERWGRKGSTQQCLKYLSNSLMSCSHQIFFAASCPTLSIRQKWPILSKGRQTLVNSFLLCVCALSFFKQAVWGFFSFFTVILILKLLKTHAVSREVDGLKRCQSARQSKSPSSFCYGQLSDYSQQRRWKHNLNIFI